MGCCSTRQKGNFELPPFEKTNYYKSPRSNESINQQQIQTIVQHIAPNEPVEDYMDIGIFISKSENKKFEDPHFMSTAPKGSWQYLENLRNQKNSQVYWKDDTRTDSFKQNELQLCYLSSVFYEICMNFQLKRQIFITKQIISEKAFIVKLFCNGTPTNVIVDEKIPVANEDNIQFINILRGKQIWPYILQKAWCKQIGGYRKALGLSPEDAFEEITGIPAYSYEISFLLDHEILDVLKRKQNWTVLTAKIGTSSVIRTRQQFYLEEIKNGKEFYLRSPYFSYEFKRQYRGGSRIIMNLDQIRQYFQFITVGYSYKGHRTISVPFISKKRQDIFYELKVKREEMINIRFSQFYEEYFQNLQEKQGYDYSPVFLQLFKANGRLIENCQGCPKSVSGNRSSHISPQIFVNLEPGTYYLRIEVDWLNERVLNRGNILIYASERNVELKKNEDESLRDKLLAEAFHDESQNHDGENEIQLNIIERKFRYLLEIINTTSKTIQCEVSLTKAENIRVKGKQLVKFGIKQRLKEYQVKVLQILPEDPKQSFYLPSISVKKI